MRDQKPNKRLEREEAERRDIEIINQNADELNAEAEVFLEFQAPILWEEEDDTS